MAMRRARKARCGWVLCAVSEMKNGTRPGGLMMGSKAAATNRNLLTNSDIIGVMEAEYPVGLENARILASCPGFTSRPAPMAIYAGFHRAAYE